MRFKWKLLAIFLLISCGPILAGRFMGVEMAKKMGLRLAEIITSYRMEDARKQMERAVIFHAKALSLKRSMAETLLDLQAEGIERLFAQNPPDGRFILASRIREGRLDLSGFTLSSTYFKSLPGEGFEPLRISWDAPVFTGFKTGDSLDDIRRLAQMTSFYYSARKLLAERIYWHQTGLENGIFCMFPANNGIPRDFDPRSQPWYRHAIDSNVPWSDPYVDPVTGQVFFAAVKIVRRPDRSIAGVTSIAFPIQSLFVGHEWAGSLPGNTRPFLVRLSLNPQTGEKGLKILADRNMEVFTHRSWRMDVEGGWLKSQDKEKFSRMISEVENGRSGYAVMRFGGRESLWAFGPVEYDGVIVFISPMSSILQPVTDVQKEVRALIDDLIQTTGIGLVLILSLISILAIIFSKSVTRPIMQLVEGAKRLGAGDFSVRVNINTKDEFGDMGRVFNRVVPQLEELSSMLQKLALANELQQNLLPGRSPDISGLEISGLTIYSDKIGGDYFDFIPLDNSGEGVIVIVGDVSDHGIASALLMATARATFRSSLREHGSIASALTAANIHLALDIGDSGQFISLFCAEFDTQKMEMRWIRAGHEPAIIYDAAKGDFSELRGQGLPLGVFKDSLYEAMTLPIKGGQIFLFATDGLFEASDEAKEMFGNDRVKRIVRDNATRPSSEILRALKDAVFRFCDPGKPEDDITMVVVKVLSYE